jgi:sugar phosphate isomerase/epimerase
MRYLIVLLAVASLAAAEDAFKPSFYAFQNGARFGPLDQEISTLKELGYDGVGSTHAGDLVKRRAAYEAAGLRIFSIYVPCNAGDGTYNKAIPQAIEALKGSGAIVQLTVQGRAKTDDNAVKAIREVADLAAKADLKVALYPHAGFYVARVPEAIRLCKTVDRPNVGLIFNLCHFLKSEKAEDLEKTMAEAKPYLFAASTCGADSDGKNWGTLIQTLDKGSFDQVRYLKALRANGLQGPVGLQCYNVKGDKKANLATSLAAWKKHLAGASP